MSTSAPPRLIDYRTGTDIRRALHQELEASVAAAHADGGAGIILVDGRACYVSGTMRAPPHSHAEVAFERTSRINAAQQNRQERAGRKAAKAAHMILALGTAL